MNTIDREWASKIVEGHEKMINERLKNLFWRAIIGSTFLAIACMIMGLTTLILLNGYDKVHQYLHYVKYESSRSMFIPSILAAIGFVFIIIIDRVNERANELETKKYTIRLLITILFIFCLFLLIFNIIIISIPYPNILSMSSFF